ncbi:MAG: ribonuclease HII [Alphaproteobacteria bacterium]|nr:ribonuclease HII [Alphaproteobacteria bacterium]
MPNWDIENEFQGNVCGVDEAGRGPWVGPVVAGAVIFLNRNINSELLNSINDSKKLSAKKRENMYDLLLAEEQAGHITYGIGEASAAEIDELNILQATFLAMKRAVQKLKILPSHALIDGNRLPADFCCPCSCHIGGDALSYSIAAASILAKVYRDNLLKKLALEYPEYGFEKNAGYGTKEHIEALNKYGVTPQHRKSYRPIKEILEAEK